MLIVARADDARQIAELQLASWRATYARELSRAFHDGQDVAAWEAQWRGRLAGGMRVLLAKEGEQLHGFVACGPSRQRSADGIEWEIYNIHVDPVRHGKGLGSALFLAAADLGRQHGARELVLWVVRTNHHARAFYARQGMHDDGGEQEHALGDETLHEVRYRMRL